MTQLSKTAQLYIDNLGSSEFYSQDDVVRILKSNQIPLHAELLYFGQYLNGLTFDYYGEFNSTLRLFWGGADPQNLELILIEKSVHPIHDGIILYHLNNPDGKNTWTVSIDETAKYYENGEQISSSILKKIEDIAMHAFVRNESTSSQVIDSDIQSKFDLLATEYQLELIEYCSDEFVDWYRTDSLIIRYSKNELVLFDFDKDDKQSLIVLIGGIESHKLAEPFVFFSSNNYSYALDLFDALKKEDIDCEFLSDVIDSKYSNEVEWYQIAISQENESKAQKILNNLQSETEVSVFENPKDADKGSMIGLMNIILGVFALLIILISLIAFQKGERVLGFRFLAMSLIPSVLLLMKGVNQILNSVKKGKS